MAKRETVGKIAENVGSKYSAKWTDERIEALGQAMLDWFEADPTRVVMAGFWASIDDPDFCWYSQLPAYLCQRSETFARYHARAKLIIESRLVTLGLQPKVNPTFMAFLLVNIAGYTPINGVNIKNDNRKLELPSVNLNVAQSPPKAIDPPYTDAQVLPPVPPPIDGKLAESPNDNPTEEA